LPVMNVPNQKTNKRNFQKERSVMLMKERIIERTVNGIRVTSHIPEDVSESFKRNRINQIYDILVAADKRTEKSDTDHTDKSKFGKSA
jgi:hypothetical protein